MAGSNFDLYLWISLFVFSVWAGGRLFRAARLPPILGQLVIGVLFGPQFGDIVPYASDGTCDTIIVNSSSHRQLAAAAQTPLKCYQFQWERWPLAPAGDRVPSVWSFLGNLGVTLMIFESGMHIHFDKVRQVGLKAAVVAVLGTMLPMVSGMGLVAVLFDSPFYPSGLAAGCAFAPTSVGISIKLLDDAKMLNSLAGQTTLTAAFIDDVFSLVLLVIMQNLSASPNLSADKVIVPIVCSFAFLGISVLLAIFVFSKLVRSLDDAPRPARCTSLTAPCSLRPKRQPRP